MFPFRARAGLEDDVNASDPIVVESTVDALEIALHIDQSTIPIVAIVAPETILDRGFFGQLAAAINDPALEEVKWTCLASSGTDIEGQFRDNGNYLDDPSMPVGYPPRILAATDPAILLVDTAELQRIAGRTDHPSLTDLASTSLIGGSPLFLSQSLRYSSLDTPRSVSNAAVGDRTYQADNHTDLTSVRPDPTISLVVRTTLKRPALLERNLDALAGEHTTDPLLEVIVASTSDSEKLSSVVEDAKSRRPDLPIRRLSVEAGLGPSRTVAMTTALNAAKGDYVWFVDDDDWITPGSIRRLKASVHARSLPILVGAVASLEEAWHEDRLISTTPKRLYEPAEWYRAFTGWNFLPNCSIVVPRVLAQRRMAVAPLHSDLGEDYALQLLLYTAPGSMVDVVDAVIANVSWRPGSDNAVTATDRAQWLRDLSSHVSDLQRDASAATAAFWQLGRAVRDLPYEPILEEAATSTTLAATDDPSLDHGTDNTSMVDKLRRIVNRRRR